MGTFLAIANCIDSFNDDLDPYLMSDFIFYHISQEGKMRNSYQVSKKSDSEAFAKIESIDLLEQQHEYF